MCPEAAGSSFPAAKMDKGHSREPHWLQQLGNIHLGVWVGLVWLFVESVCVQLINSVLIFWSCCCKNSWKLESQRWLESRASVGWLDLWKRLSIIPVGSQWTCCRPSFCLRCGCLQFNALRPLFLPKSYQVLSRPRPRTISSRTVRTVSALSRRDKKLWCSEEIAEYRVFFYWNLGI